MDSVVERTSEARDGSEVDLKGALVLDEGKVRSHLDEVVRSTVEQTLNGLLDAEARSYTKRTDACGAPVQAATGGVCRPKEAWWWRAWSQKSD